MSNTFNYQGHSYPVRSDVTTKPFLSNDNTAMFASSSDLIAAYDSLMAEHPEYVSKSTISSGTFTNAVYKFTTGNYNAYSEHSFSQDSEEQKTKVLLTVGIHGYEKSCFMGAYMFFKQLCENAEPLRFLRENIEIDCIPCVNPYGFNHNTRYNENNVDLNRNFDASWISQGSPYASGSSAASENETKAVQAWIDENTDASVLFDFHNQEETIELAHVQSSGKGEDVVLIKKNILRAMDNVIALWKQNRELSLSNRFFYTGSSMTDHGMLSMYARDKGIPSLILETSWNVDSSGQHSNLTCNVSADALFGAILGAVCS